MSTLTMKSSLAIAMTTPMPAGRTFDDIIKNVNAGDDLRCVLAVSGEDFFTEGDTYTVVEGSEMMSPPLTIRDNEGMEVPDDVFGRIPILDLFEVVPTAPVLTLVPTVTLGTTFAEMYDGERMALLKAWKDGKNIEAQWKVDGTWNRISDPVFFNNGIYRAGKTDEEMRIDAINAEIVDLAETIASFEKLVRDLNTSGDFTPWDEMSREAKANLLLSKLEGKKFQSSYTLDQEWTLQPDPSWFDNLAYRVKPDALTSAEEELKAFRDQYKALEDELESLLPDDEDDYGPLFW